MNQEYMFWAKFGRFWAKNPNLYLREEQKFWYITEKHLRTLFALFFGRTSDQMSQATHIVSEPS